MSSIVSRRPPFCGSVSHSNERRWISIRLGTSQDLFRRAKVRRVRRASAAAKEDSFEERDDTTSAQQRKASATRQDSTRQRHPQVGSWRSRTPPLENPRMWRGSRASKTAAAIGQRARFYRKIRRFVSRG